MDPSSYPSQQPFNEPFDERFTAPQQEFYLFGRSPRSTEYYSVIYKLIQDLESKSCSSVRLDQPMISLLERARLVDFEFVSKQEKSSVPGIPFFERDRVYHEELVSLGKAFKQIVDYQSFGEVGYERIVGNVEDLLEDIVFDPYRFSSVEGLLNQISKQIGELATGLTQRARDCCFDSERKCRVQLTHHGSNLADALSGYHSNFVKELTTKVFILFSENRQDAEQRTFAEWSNGFAEHLQELRRMKEYERDLRKLFYAMLENDPSLSPFDIVNRTKDVRVDHAIDTYLQGGDSYEVSLAADYLRDLSGGSYCPIPFPSWSGRVDEIYERSREVVLRGRREAYLFGRLAIDFKRMPDGGDALGVRFAKEKAEQVFAIYGSDLDTPPGRGMVVSGIIPERVFFYNDKSRDPLESYRSSYGAFLDPAIDYLESSGFAFLRGAKVVFNHDPLFSIDGTPYCRVVFNDHLSGGYGGEWLFAQSVVLPLLAKSAFEIDLSQSLSGTADITKLKFTPSGLCQRSRDLGFSPLNMSWLSTLFGGCSHAYPPCSEPYFEWERADMHVVWKDSNKHVHASYRIWDFQNNRRQVDNTLRPLQELDDKVYRVVSMYQALSELYERRYAAWRNDQTPGAIEAPLMLRDLYRWHQAKDCQTNPVYLCLVDRENLAAKPVPIADSASMSLIIDGNHIALPERGDGSENQEIVLWNRYVKPLLLENGWRESFKDLVFLNREYLNY